MHCCVLANLQSVIMLGVVMPNVAALVQIPISKKVSKTSSIDPLFKLNPETWGQCYKTFYGHNLQTLGIN